MSAGIGILGTIYYSISALSTRASGSDNGLPWWANLLIAIIPTILGFVLDLIVKKGWITSKTSDEVKKVVDEVADDLKDDGKLNGSNKKDKEDE